MLKGYKALFKLINIMANKYLPLFIIQMCTFGIIVAANMLFMPIIIQSLFDSMQTGVFNNVLISCGVSSAFLIFMVIINYVNNVIIDLNFFKASYGIAAQCFMEYHELPFFKLCKYESGDVFNRINTAGPSIAKALVLSVSTISSVIGMGVLLYMCVLTSWYLAAISMILAIVCYFSMYFQSTGGSVIQESIQQVQGTCEVELHNLIHEMEFYNQNETTDTPILSYCLARSAVWDKRKKGILLEAYTICVTDTIGYLLRMALPYFLLPLQVSGFLTMGAITAAFTLLDSLRGSVSQILSQVKQVVESIVPVCRLQELITDDYDSISSEQPKYTDTEIPISINGLHLTIDDKVLLYDINLDIKKHSKTAIIGRNGCGKSSLLRTILGLYEPDSGHALLCGIESSELRPSTKREVLSFIPSRNQLFSVDCKNNVLMNANLIDESSLQTALHAAAIPNADDSFFHAEASKLSGGQSQRVNVARGLIHKPGILLADEPTAALDPETGHYVMQSLINADCTIIVITHEPKYLCYFDNIVLMEHGKIVAQGDFESVKRHPAYLLWASE